MNESNESGKNGQNVSGLTILNKVGQECPTYM